MADYKTLDQANPAATTNTTLYTAPAPAIASTLMVCNQGSSAATFRVAIRPAAAGLAAKHYVLYDEPLGAVGAGNSAIYTVGWSFAQTDVVTVYASTANVSFTLMGCENP